MESIQNFGIIETDKYYKSILNLTNDMIALFDGKRILDANKSFLSFFRDMAIDVYSDDFFLAKYFLKIDKYGYIYDGYLNRSWIENILAAEKEHYRVSISKHEKIYTFGISIKKLEISENIFVITFSDISDLMSYRCLLEEDVRSSHYEKENTQYILNQYNHAIDTSNLVARCDLQGNITYVNDALCATLEYNKEELLGKSIAIMFEQNSEIMCQKIAWQNVYNGDIWKGIVKNIGKYGSVHYFATTIIPIQNKENQIIEILSIRHDITEMVKAKEEALKTLEAKSKFFDQVSHELRTPLNAIVNFTDQALESYDEIVTDEESRLLVKRFLQRAYANAENLLELINSLLDIAKMKSGKTEFKHEPHNAIILAKEAFENCFSLQQYEEVAYSFETLEQEVFIECDGFKLKQIITNLISNALKFTKSGYVKVRVSSTPTECSIEVFDTGIGIPKDKINTVFEPFEQVRDHGFGTGLGLNIVREYAQAMHMKVAVDSQENQGSCFGLVAKKLAKVKI
ncbi:MAG: ATP-binding protein [Sulfurimonas sp.]|nr:ATP-binding protein [Sulfurimonas sp.]MDD5203044.1 ATP-binding protein [Sulfurimonas sp.]